MKFILIIALLLALVVVVMLLLRPSGPRVTRIEHRRDHSDDSDGGGNGD